jgi:hypothetical protein
MIPTLLIPLQERRKKGYHAEQASIVGFSCYFKQFKIVTVSNEVEFIEEKKCFILFSHVTNFAAIMTNVLFSYKII